jgi:hypothetical protein
MIVLQLQPTVCTFSNEDWSGRVQIKARVWRAGPRLGTINRVFKGERLGCDQR